MTSRRKPRQAAPDAVPSPAQVRRTLVAPGASAAEAAAIVAALERYLADTALPATPPPPTTRPGRWLRAALLDGIGRGERRRGAWGDPHP